MSEAVVASSSSDVEMNDVVALLKPRVMSLVVFTAAVGVLVAPAPMHPVLAMASILFIAVGAGASGALNMWWDADIDALMRRTRNRPVPSGKVSREDALLIGGFLSGLSIVMLGLTSNVFAAGLLAFTIFFYVVVYTMFLKRLTPQNIVIGGAAGALPPVIGWAAATGGVSWEGLLMFLLIFVWTPPHFWSLALFANEDYAKAKVPMLTVTHGPAATRRNILFYSLLLIPISLLLVVTSIGGPVYFAVAIVMNAAFASGAWKILVRDDRACVADGWLAEKRFFRLSLAYLFALFAGLAIEAVLRWTFGEFSFWPAWI